MIEKQENYRVRESEAYAEGCNARNEGKSRDSNPYGGLSDLWDQWDEGWLDTDKDLKEVKN